MSLPLLLDKSGHIQQVVFHHRQINKELIGVLCLERAILKMNAVYHERWSLWQLPLYNN